MHVRHVAELTARMKPFQGPGAADLLDTTAWQKALQAVAGQQLASVDWSHILEQARMVVEAGGAMSAQDEGAPTVDDGALEEVDSPETPAGRDRVSTLADYLLVYLLAVLLYLTARESPDARLAVQVGTSNEVVNIFLVLLAAYKAVGNEE